MYIRVSHSGPSGLLRDHDRYSGARSSIGVRGEGMNSKGAIGGYEIIVFLKISLDILKQMKRKKTS